MEPYFVLFNCAKQQISLCSAGRAQGRENKEQRAVRMWHHPFPRRSGLQLRWLGVILGAVPPGRARPGAREPRLWRPVSPRLIHVQEWEGQGHRHTPASCCLLFPASPGGAPSPNMTGGWSSQGNNVMGQFSRKAVNSIHKPGPSDGKGTWLRRGGEGLLCCYLWFFWSQIIHWHLLLQHRNLYLCTVPNPSRADCGWMPFNLRNYGDAASANPTWPFDVSQAAKDGKRICIFLS